MIYRCGVNISVKRWILGDRLRASLEIETAKRFLSHHLQFLGSGDFGNGSRNSVKRLRFRMVDLRAEAGNLKIKTADSKIIMIDGRNEIDANRTNIWKALKTVEQA